MVALKINEVEFTTTRVSDASPHVEQTVGEQATPCPSCGENLEAAKGRGHGRHVATAHAHGHEKARLF